MALQLKILQKIKPPMRTVCTINKAVAFKQKLNTTASMPKEEMLMSCFQPWQQVPMKQVLAQGWK
eukprot:9723917-Ditylum_brightwellii.AAC.1